MARDELVMDFSEYAEAVYRGMTSRQGPDDIPRLAAMLSMGLSGEAGEITDEWKKVLFHGKEIDMDKFIEELGDLLWYFTNTSMLLGIEFHEIYQNNLRKLIKRYPDDYPGYDPETLERKRYGQEGTVANEKVSEAVLQKDNGLVGSISPAAEQSEETASGSGDGEPHSGGNG